MSPGTRGLAARMLVALAAVAIAAALVVGYLQRAALNSDQFANRATTALRDDSVRTLIAEEITDRVVLATERDLLAARPLIQSIAADVVSSSAFTGLYRRAVRDVHRAVIHGDQDTVTLTLRDVGTLLAAGLEIVRPALADSVRGTGRVEVLQRDIGHAAAEAGRVADSIRVAALLLVLLSVALVAAGIAISPDRRRTVVDLGVGVALSGAVLVVALAVLRSVAVDQVDGAEQRAAAGAVWAAFLQDLRTAAWVLAGAGAVVAGAAASLIRPVDVDVPLRRIAAWAVRTPVRPIHQALRAVALIALGVLLLTQREAILQLVFALAGIYLIYAGVSALLVLTAVPSGDPIEPTHGSWLRRQRPAFAAAALVVVTLVAAPAIFVGSGGVTEAAPARGGCLGYEQLCDRPLDEVVLPATHNSMSAPLPGFYSALQDGPIPQQLRDGVRGLLFDTHYADRLPNGRLRTDVTATRAAAERDGVSPSAVDAALRIRGRLGFEGQGTRGMYLCHTFCELGGTPLGDVLTEIRDFLVANPEEVMVVVNQDYITPEDFVGAVEDAGLAELTYAPPASGRWATLRELIDRNRRIVFLAENHAGAARWYQLAYKSLTEETPFEFSKVRQLLDAEALPASCRPNRGPERAPLFLMNHWIGTDPVPLPSNAARVNAYRPLLARARECMGLRDHVPNLVAVDFYGRGDLFRVVDTLNGVPTG